MKRKTRRDWGPLLTAFDGKARPPLSKRSAPRTPLAVALARDEAAEHAVAAPDVALGERAAVEATIGTNNGCGRQEGRQDAPPASGPFSKATVAVVPRAPFVAKKVFPFVTS